MFRPPIRFFKTIGSQIISLGEVTSTQDFAFGLLRKNEDCHGTIICAESQTCGKGRKEGRKWISESNQNLYFSIILQNIQYSELSKISFSTPVSIIDCLEKDLFAEKLSIKWPNDVLHDKKKLCGILIDVNSFSEQNLKAKREEPPSCDVVIGIGLNVGEKVSGIPNTETSCLMDIIIEGEREKMKPSDLTKDLILQQLCESFEKWLIEPFETSYNKYKEKMFGDEILVKKEDDQFRAKVLDVEQNGSLKIKKEGQSEIEYLFSMDEVKILES